MCDPKNRTFDIVFGFAFDVERNASSNSGFQPAHVDLGSGLELFGDLRLEGFAALMRMGFTKRLIIVGGDEGRYKGEKKVINRAEAIKKMLEMDCHIPAHLIEAIPSRSNTGGNVKIIGRETRKHGKGAYAAVSNHYHLPRIEIDLNDEGVHIPGFAAESFTIRENASRKEDIIRIISGPAYAERCAEEMQGIGQKLDWTYVPRTDVQANGWFTNLRQRLRTRA